MTHLLSQITDVTSGIDPLALNLASVASVVTVTTLLIQRVIKPLAIAYPDSVGRVPTQVFVLILSAALTYVANRFLVTLPGDNVWRLIRDAVVASFMSPGLYTQTEAWKGIASTKARGFFFKKDAGPTVAQSASPFRATRMVFLVPTLGLLLLMLGCSPASSPFYNGVNAQWPPIRDTYNAYVDHDATLSPAARQVLKESSATMDDLIKREGARQAASPTTQP